MDKVNTIIGRTVVGAFLPEKKNAISLKMQFLTLTNVFFYEKRAFSAKFQNNSYFSTKSCVVAAQKTVSKRRFFLTPKTNVKIIE